MDVISAANIKGTPSPKYRAEIEVATTEAEAIGHALGPWKGSGIGKWYERWEAHCPICRTTMSVMEIDPASAGGRSNRPPYMNHSWNGRGNDEPCEHPKVEVWRGMRLQDPEVMAQVLNLIKDRRHDQAAAAILDHFGSKGGIGASWSRREEIARGYAKGRVTSMEWGLDGYDFDPDDFRGKDTYLPVLLHGWFDYADQRKNYRSEYVPPLPEYEHEAEQWLRKHEKVRVEEISVYVGNRWEMLQRGRFMVTASNVPFTTEPHETLYPCIWTQGDEPVMREDASAILREVVMAFVEGVIPDVTDEQVRLWVIGSGASFNWDEDGDLDVQVWVDTDAETLAEIRIALEPTRGKICADYGLGTPESPGRMQIQFFARAGKGTLEETTSRMPYAAYDVDSGAWAVFPEPLTPKGYAQKFLTVQPQAELVGEQIQEALAEHEQALAAYRYWKFMADVDPEMAEYASQAQESLDEAVARCEALYDLVVIARQKAYLPGGLGISDPRDTIVKVLEVWGLFDPLKHIVQEKRAITTTAATGLYWHVAKKRPGPGTILVPGGPGRSLEKPWEPSEERKDDRNWVWLSSKIDQAYTYYLNLTGIYDDPQGKDPVMVLAKPRGKTKSTSSFFSEALLAEEAEVVAMFPMSANDAREKYRNDTKEMYADWKVSVERGEDFDFDGWEPLYMRQHRERQRAKQAAFGDSPDEQKALEELADLLTGPVPGKKYEPLFGEMGAQYGGYISGTRDGRLLVDGKPLKTLYRIVDPGEWEDAQRNGYLQSDAASGSGYTRASAKPDETWRNQKGRRGYTLEIQYDPADGWRASAEGYAATHNRIPLSRVKKIGSKTASTITLYRGFKVALSRQVMDLLQPPTTEAEIDQHLKAGKAIVEMLQHGHWDAGVGLGRHWTTSKQVAGNVQGAGQTVILTAQVSPDAYETDERRIETHSMEYEITLRPGGQVLVTNVEIEGNYTSDTLGGILGEPIRATAVEQVSGVYQYLCDQHAGDRKPQGEGQQTNCAECDRLTYCRPYHPDDGPRIRRSEAAGPLTLYRGIALPVGLGVTDEDMADAIRSSLQSRGVGVHWSTSKDVARDEFSMMEGPGPGNVAVVLTAEVSPADLETDQALMDQMEVWRPGLNVSGEDEQEVTLRRGAPVRIKAIDWHEGGPWRGQWRSTSQGLSVEAAGPSWRAIGTQPFWTWYEACIVSFVAGPNRSFEVYLHGKQVANRHSLAEAKEVIDRQYGPQQWKRNSLPLVEVEHYFFGLTTEFTDPLTYYSVDFIERSKSASLISESATKTLYHGTDVALSPGDRIEPGKRSNYQTHVYEGKGVSLSDTLDMALFYAVLGTFSSARFNPVHVYEVTSEDARLVRANEYEASGAIVVREVTDQAKVALRREWDSWSQAVAMEADESMRAMLTYEFERAMR